MKQRSWTTQTVWIIYMCTVHIIQDLKQICMNVCFIYIYCTNYEHMLHMYMLYTCYMLLTEQIYILFHMQCTYVCTFSTKALTLLFLCFIHCTNISSPFSWAMRALKPLCDTTVMHTTLQWQSFPAPACNSSPYAPWVPLYTANKCTDHPIAETEWDGEKSISA